MLLAAVMCRRRLTLRRELAQGEGCQHLRWMASMNRREKGYRSGSLPERMLNGSFDSHVWSTLGLTVLLKRDADGCLEGQHPNA